jgi:hypothetical protein
MLARPKATPAVRAHGLTRAPAALAHLDRAQAEEGDDQQRQAWDRRGVSLAPPSGARRLDLGEPEDHVADCQATDYNPTLVQPSG